MNALILRWVRVLVGGILVVSLITNYMFYKHAKHGEQYVRFSYNQFIYNVDRAAEMLGKVNHDPPDYQRAAVDTADAANILYALDHYESIVQNPRAGIPTTPYIDQIAIFLSYVSLAFVRRNEAYDTSEGVITMSQSSAKKTLFKLDDILMSNMKDSNIPQERVATVFNQIYNLIPANFHKWRMLEFFYH